MNVTFNLCWIVHFCLACKIFLVFAEWAGLRIEEAWPVQKGLIHNFTKKLTKAIDRLPNLIFCLFFQKMQSSSKEEPPKKKSDWRKKRADFIAALRAAKEAQRHLAAGGKISDLPPPPPSDTSDYIQCPHCARRFNESAAERHIPKCKNIISNKRRWYCFTKDIKLQKS